MKQLTRRAIPLRFVAPSVRAAGVRTDPATVVLDIRHRWTDRVVGPPKLDRSSPRPSAVRSLQHRHHHHHPAGVPGEATLAPTAAEPNVGRRSRRHRFVRTAANVHPAAAALSPWDGATGQLDTADAGYE